MSRRADAVCGPADCATSETHTGVGPASRWPYLSYLELGALPSAVPSARLHARLIAHEWGLGELADTVELIVSELVTNAIQASQGLFGSRFQGQWAPGPPPVRLWLQSNGSSVLIQVWDGSDRMPHREMPELDRENGRGLLLVEALCRKYGTYVLDGSSGKVVWGEVARTLPSPWTLATLNTHSLDNRQPR